MDCPLCNPARENVVWQDDRCRVILVDDPDHSGYCRVVWHEHVAEMTDLDPAARRHAMDVTLAVERVLRDMLQPDKMNLASLGNMVPHLHWHVVARFADDRHFPESIWGREQRPGRPRPAPAREELSERIAAEIKRTTLHP